MFDRIFAHLAGKEPAEHIMIDATHLKAHRTAASLLKKGMFPAVSGAPREYTNSKLHVVCDSEGKPLIMLLSEGQMNQHTGAKLLSIQSCLPPNTLIADKGYDSDEFREALAAEDQGLHSTEAEPKDPARLRQATLQDPPQD